MSPRLSHRRDALSPPITHLLIAAVLIMLLATIVNLSLVGRGDGPLAAAPSRLAQPALAFGYPAAAVNGERAW